jgi:predicted transposase YbfD/YdcC
VCALFTWATDAGFAEMEHDRCMTVGKGHGRLETRTCTTISDLECLAMLSDRDDWAALHTVIHVHAKRQIGTDIAEEDRYYLSDLPGDTPNLASQALEAVRTHWGIENQLHWVLDVAFREDTSRIRAGNSGENFAVLRHIALNLLRRDKSTRLGIEAKRHKAGWDTQYLLKLLAL